MAEGHCDLLMNNPGILKQKRRAWATKLARRAAVAAVGSVALLLSGCTAPTRATKPTITLPPSWNSVTGDTVQSPAGDLSQWWKRFGDDILSDLIGQALKNNTSLRTARANLREARAERNLASANRFPTVTASLSGTSNASNSPGGSTGNVLSEGLDASWEPDVFGSYGDALRAARADVGNSEATLQNALVSLVAEVALDYVDLRSYQMRLEISRQNAASEAETLQITEWRAQAGLVSSIDVEQARYTLEQTRAGIPSLEIDVAQSEHALSTLLGVSPGSLSHQLAAPAPIPSVPDTVAVGIPADTLRQRPDVRAAEQKIVAETARLGQNNAARYPSFSLSGSFLVEQLLGTASGGAVSGGTTIALMSGTTLLGIGSGTVTQTLFDRGRIRQQIEIQSAVQEQAVISYESTVLTALQDVEDSLVSFEKSRERLAALNTAADAARDAAALARTRYTAGLVDFQTVLDTERTVLSIEDSAAQTQADRTTALIKLYKALGGGWSSAAGTNSISAKQGQQS
jgi:multidrug efflux system outer membrane protein